MRIEKFKGMNNVQGADGNPSMPEVILNADNNAQGEIVARQGKSRIKDLEGAHSLWANRELVFVAAKGILYRFDVPSNTLHEVTGLGADGPVYYATVGQDVYIAAPGMLGKYSTTMGIWGTPLPVRPQGSLVSGDLQPGQYHVCYTKKVNGKHSGSSPVSSFNVGEGQGIFLTNVGDNDVWITDPGGGELQWLGMRNVIVEQPVGGEPIQTLGAYPPAPGLSFIWWVFGRIWGFFGDKLIYSTAFDPELFHDNNFFDIGSAGTMIAPVNGGLYVATEKTTRFMSGRDPQRMSVSIVGAGAVRGSLGFARQLPEMGNNLPIWMTDDGIMAGTHDGQVINLTQRKVQLTPSGKYAAALARQHNGDVQYITSFKRKSNGTGAQFGDNATAEVFRNGKLIGE